MDQDEKINHKVIAQLHEYPKMSQSNDEEDPIEHMKLYKFNHNKESTTELLQNPPYCVEIRCGARDTIFHQKHQDLDDGDIGNLEVIKDPDTIEEETRKYMKQLKKLGKLGKSLYDTYYDILLGKVHPEQMSALINQFFNTGDDTNKNYCNERDCHRGDFVIKFPNPDHPNYVAQNIKENAITHLKKDVIFIKLFQIINRADQRERQDQKIIQKAYNNAFNQLENYYTAKEKEEIDILHQKITKLQQLLEYTKSTKQKREILNANDANNPIYQLKQFTDKDKERKISFGGKFLQPVVLENEDEKIPQDYSRPWKATGRQTADYCTLIRNLFMIRLIKVGFQLRSFLSKNGEFIYVVVYAEDYNLKITSEADKMKIQIRSEFCDILSFEPVDEQLRPYRLSSTIWNKQLQEVEEIEDKKSAQKDTPVEIASTKQQQSYLIMKIKEMISKINYLQILKETNCQNLNQSLYTYGQRDFTDHVPPTNQQLALYYEYLIYLHEKITSIRSKYYYKYEDAYKINNANEQLNKFKFKKKREKIKEKKKSLEIITEKLPEEAQDTEDEYRDKLLLIKGRENLLNKLLCQPHKPNQKQTLKHDNFPSLMQKAPNPIPDRKNNMILKGLVQAMQQKLQIDNDPRKQRKRRKNISQKQREREDLLIMMNQMTQKITEDQIPQTKLDHIHKYMSIKQQYSLKSHKVLHTKIIKLRKQSILAHEYKKKFETALTVINYPFRGKKFFQNIWDRIGFKEQPCFYEYFTLPSNISFKKRLKADIIWQGHILTETGRVSQFSNMERLKLINSTILKAFNVYYVKQQGFITSMFALNDQYELEGKSTIINYDHYFKSIEKTNTCHKTTLLELQLNIQGEKPQKALKSKMQKGYISTVNSKKQGVIQRFCYNFQEYTAQEVEQQRIKNLMKIQKEIKEGAQKDLISYEQKRDNKFLKAKLKNLELIWKFRIREPWFVPTEQIKDYYGEKIAMYFNFLGFYISKLAFISILGIVIQLLDLIIPDDSYEWGIIKIIYGTFVTMWGSYTIYSWQRQEQMLAILFGTYSIGKVTKEADKERPNLEGDYKRSLESDNLNAMTSSQLMKTCKIGISILLCFCVLVLYFTVVLFIFDFNYFLRQNIEFPDAILILEPHISIPAIINYILIFILEEFVYKYVAEKLTEMENHQNNREYESNYILKRYFLSFVSLIIPMMTIGILNKRVGIQCDNCMRDATSYFKVLYILMFIVNIKDLVWPKIELRWRKYQEKSKNKLNESENTSKLEIKEVRSMTPRGGANALILNIKDQAGPSPKSTTPHQVDSQPIKSSIQHKKTKSPNLPIRQEDKFDDLNQFIEQQSDNFSEYSQSMDIYGTVDNYMELIMQFNVLIMLGIDFPLAFLLGFIWEIADLRSGKSNLMKTIQRPVPCTETSIGIFNDLLELGVYISILFNSAVVSFHFHALSITHGKNENVDGFFLFLILIVTNFVLTFVLSEVFVDIPDRLREIFLRQKYLMKSTIEIYKKVKEKKEELESKPIEMDEFEIYEQNAKQLQYQAYLDQMRKKNKIFKRTRIYKIFGTVINPKNQEDEDISFRSESSAGEEQKDQQENKKVQKRPIMIKKKKRNLWLESKVFNQQLYLQRPFILRRNYCKKKDEASGMQEKRLMDSLMKQMAHKTKNSTKLKFTNSICFHVPLVDFNSLIRRILQPDKLQLLFQICHKKESKRSIKDKQNQPQTLTPTSFIFSDVAAFRHHKWEKIMDELISLSTKKCILDKQSQEPFKSPYFIYSSVCERFIWQIEEQKIQSEIQAKNTQLRLLQLIPFTLLARNKEKNSSHPITSEKPYINYTPQKWIYRLKGKKEKKLMIFIEIRMNNYFHYHILKKNKEMLILMNKNSKVDFYMESFCQIEQQYLFPAESLQYSECNKGYYATCYRDQYICTLDDIIKSRRTRNLPYQEIELIYFIDWLLYCIDQLQSHNSCHSSINPWNIIISEESVESYKLTGVNHLYKYDTNEGKIYFIRDIQKYESLFYSKEINECFKTGRHFDPNNEDVYSVAMVILYMMTLGNFTIDMKKCNNDIQAYLHTKTLSFIQSYPVIFTLVKEMIEHDSINRKKPNEYRIMIKNNLKIKLIESQSLIARKREKNIYLIMRHTKVPVLLNYEEKAQGLTKTPEFRKVPSRRNFDEKASKNTENIKKIEEFKKLNKLRQEQAGSMNHFLHTCSIYNKLRMYDCTIKLCNKVININKIEESYKRGVSQKSGRYYTTQSTYPATQSTLPTEQQGTYPTEQRGTYPTEQQDSKIFDEEFSVNTYKIGVSEAQSVVFNADFFVLGAKTFLYNGLLQECEEYLKEGEKFINCKIQESKDILENSDEDNSSSDSSSSNKSPQKTKRSGASPQKKSRLKTQKSGKISLKSNTMISQFDEETEQSWLQSKLQHILQNLYFIRLIKEWIQMNKDDMKNYKTSELTEKIFVKLLKRNHDYMTSSRNNLIRLLNTMRIMFMILVDLNNFKYLQEIQRKLEQLGFSILNKTHDFKLNLGRSHDICKDKFEMSILSHFIKEFNILYVISFTNQIKFNQAYEKMEQIVQFVLYNTQKNCILIMKDSLITYQMISDLCICLEKEVEFTAFQQDHVQSIIKKFFSFNNDHNLMVYILDYFEYVVHLVEFQTDKEDVIHIIIECLQNIQEDRSGKNFITEFILGKLKCMLGDQSLNSEIQEHFNSSYAYLQNLSNQQYCRYFRSRVLQNIIYNTPLSNQQKHKELLNEYISEHSLKKKREDDEFSLYKLNNSESLAKIYFFQEDYSGAEKIMNAVESLLNARIEQMGNQDDGLTHLYDCQVRLKVWNLYQIQIQSRPPKGNANSPLSPTNVLDRCKELPQLVCDLMKHTYMSQKIFIIKFLIELITLFREEIYYSNATNMSKIIYKYIQLMSKSDEKTQCLRDYFTIIILITLENLEIQSELSFEKHIAEVSKHEVQFSSLRNQIIYNLTQLKEIFPSSKKIHHGKINQLLVFIYEQDGHPFEALISFYHFKEIQLSLGEVQNEGVEQTFREFSFKELMELGILSKEAQILLHLQDYQNSLRLFRIAIKKANKFMEIIQSRVFDFFQKLND